jgi:iron complex outermembrane receptor protein
MKNPYFNSYFSAGFAIGLIFLSSLLFADERPEKNSLLYMDIEQLTEVQIAVSASRQEQKLSEVSVPVAIITSDDIHYSGLTNVPEILQFATGVDVRRLDRQRYIVGVRGLSGTFSDRTLVLIDGRPAMDPIYGTTHWEHLPVLIEDIERIEIVRGPGGAAWGANAFNGVVNIITKKPGDVLGGFGSTTISEFGDTYTHLRWAAEKNNWNWRISAGYEDVEDSDAAGAGKYYSGVNAIVNGLMGFNNFNARDWGRYWRFDTQAEYQINDKTSLSFGAAHTSGQEGDFEFVGVYPRRDFLTEYTRAFVRLDHQFNEDTKGYIQWFSDYWTGRRRVVTELMSYMENDLEGQLTFKPFDNHTTSIGGNIRWNRLTSHNHSSTDEFMLDRGVYNEYWAGAFLIDRWATTDRVTLEGQIRLDYYSETTTDWSGRFTALYAMDEQNNHIIRASFARAFRAPDVGVRRGNASYLQVPFLGGLFLTRSPADKTLNDEGTYSLEAGYIGKLTENLSLDVDTYYQRMERLIGVNITTNQFTGVTTSTFDNTSGANAYGVETALTWQSQTTKITGWYAYNGFSTDEFAVQTRSIYPSQNKAGIIGRFSLDKNWVFNTNYVFQNCIHVFGSVVKDPHSFNRLDFTLSRKIAEGKGEIMVGVSDILNETTPPTFDSGYLTSLETPGRMFFARLQLRF